MKKKFEIAEISLTVLLVFSLLHISILQLVDDDECAIVTTVAIIIEYARTGDISNYSYRLTSVNYVYGEAISVEHLRNSSIPIKFFVKFFEMATKPYHIYKPIPKIDFSLPSDFFYPFLSSKSIAIRIIPKIFINFFLLFFIFHYC